MAGEVVAMVVDTVTVVPRRVSAAARGGTPLLAVVGYDGTPPARAALESAVAMIGGRPGHLEIVYVAHMPWCATLTGESMLGVREGLNNLARDLELEVRAALDDREPRWHFQRRDGDVPVELLKAARELRRRHGGRASVTVVVGASESRAHRLLGAVSTGLTRRAQFPVLVV